MLIQISITGTRAGNFHAQVLVNAFTDLPIRGKYIPLTKTIKKNRQNMKYEYEITQKLTVLLGTFYFTEKLMQIDEKNVRR